MIIIAAYHVAHTLGVGQVMVAMIEPNYVMTKYIKIVITTTMSDSPQTGAQVVESNGYLSAMQCDKDR